MALIHYILVARKNKKVLCDYAEEIGNVAQISLKILKIVKPNHKTSITYDDKYTFFYINDTKITILCMCDKTYPTESAFELLKDIIILFYDKFSEEQINQAYSYSLNKEFQNVLRQKMSYYNKNIDLKRNTTIHKLKDSLVETKDALIETTETLQERGEAINLIMKKADSLKIDSKIYFENAKKVKQRAKGCNFQYIYYILILISLCYCLASILCGGIFLPNCFTG